MQVSMRFSSKFILTVIVIINVLFICLLQFLFLSRYPQKSSFSSSLFSSIPLASSSSNKTAGKSRSTDNKAVPFSDPNAIINFEERSDLTQGNRIKEAIKRPLRRPSMTKEQLMIIDEMKKKIAAQQATLNHISQEKDRNGNPIEILISPERFCQTSSPVINLARRLLVIMVTSHTQKARVRKTIRQTWADVPEVKSGQVHVVYLLGTTVKSDGQSQSLIEHEAKEYDDIIQGAFEDTYENLPAKTLMGLQWAATQCGSSFKFFMKTDSDVYVNIPKLATYLDGYRNWAKPYAMGRKWVNVKPIRLQLHKWFVPEHEYPGSTYPPYLGGSAYVITSVAIRMAFHEARSTKLVRLEDLFVGICFQKAGVQLDDEPRFRISLYNIVSRPCQIHSLFTLHGVKFFNFKLLKETQDHPNTCPNNGTSID
ncbi:beta-1,3-galactosyltransferase 5-like [Lytechinus pictus]|uniref:beta-1,3-galactosyltransferase 5-like n=1 Tax=Lytechinus pictus TaxID=7653 RepID=UPI0030BA011B